MSWFLRGIKKGVKTERFPVGDPEYKPGWSTEISGEGPAECPTGAIDNGRWIPERCIFCRRCYPNYKPTGNVRIGKIYRTNGMFSKSLHVYTIDVGSCGGCNQEINALTSPHYDMNRLGIFFVNTPRQADALVVLGPLSESMREPLMRAYQAMPEPKLVVAGCSCAVVNDFPLKFDAVIPGSPPNPYTMLDVLIKLGRNKK
jgi:Ni,Fe-hydrogenase III small subunit